jgi:hypothetical protein
VLAEAFVYTTTDIIGIVVTALVTIGCGIGAYFCKD